MKRNPKPFSDISSIKLIKTFGKLTPRLNRHIAQTSTLAKQSERWRATSELLTLKNVSSAAEVLVLFPFKRL